jgi:hypothetical protein
MNGRRSVPFTFAVSLRPEPGTERDCDKGAVKNVGGAPGGRKIALYTNEYFRTAMQHIRL